VVLQEPQVQELFRRTASARGGYDLTVDLVERSVSDGQGFQAGFVMDDYRREMLLQGLDEIGKTLRNEPAIAAFESRRDVPAVGVPA
jgi:3-isopropylmalate/(R)-2-methylmalate dehydratase small subunit